MQLEKIDLKRFSNHFSGYTELRLHENVTQSIALLNGDVVGNSRSASGGVSSRVFDQGAWGFSSSADVQDESIIATIQAATRNASFIAGRSEVKHPDLPPAKGSSHSDFRTDKPRKSSEEIIGFLKEVDRYIASNCPELESRQVSLSALDMQKKLHTSDGPHQAWPTSAGETASDRNPIPAGLPTSHAG